MVTLRILARSPLSRQPLDGKRIFAAVVLMALATRQLGSLPASREFEYRCTGLEAYEIRGTYEVDAGGGSIRSKIDPFSIGLALGPMIAQSIPQARRAGLRWMKTEILGAATLRYGFDVKQRQIQATILGAPINTVVNLAGSPRDESRFLAVARAIATAPCQLAGSPND